MRYTGGCHCEAVQFEVDMELEGLISCNCSHCQKKGFILGFVDNERFTLLKGDEHLTDYFFNKKSIRHRFCKICGTQPFAEGVAFPQTAINVRCLDDVDLSSLSVSLYNGKDL